MQRYTKHLIPKMIQWSKGQWNFGGEKDYALHTLPLELAWMILRVKLIEQHKKVSTLHFVYVNVNETGFATMEFQPLVHTFFVLGWKDYSHFNIHVSNRTLMESTVNVTGISVSIPGSNNGDCQVHMVEGPGMIGQRGGVLRLGVRDSHSFD